MTWTCYVCTPPTVGAGRGRLLHAHYLAAHFRPDAPPVRRLPSAPARLETIAAARAAARQR